MTALNKQLTKKKRNKVYIRNTSGEGVPWAWVALSAIKKIEILYFSTFSAKSIEDLSNECYNNTRVLNNA